MGVGFVLVSAAYLSVMAGIFTQGLRSAVRTQKQAKDTED